VRASSFFARVAHLARQQQQEQRRRPHVGRFTSTAVESRSHGTPELIASGCECELCTAGLAEWEERVESGELSTSHADGTSTLHVGPGLDIRLAFDPSGKPDLSLAEDGWPPSTEPKPGPGPVIPAGVVLPPSADDRPWLQPLPEPEAAKPEPPDHYAIEDRPRLTWRGHGGGRRGFSQIDQWISDQCR
jgi:hypothetical protein